MVKPNPDRIYAAPAHTPHTDNQLAFFWRVKTMLSSMRRMVAGGEIRAMATAMTAGLGSVSAATATPALSAAAAFGARAAMTSSRTFSTSLPTNDRLVQVRHTLHPTPYTLHPTPYNLNTYVLGHVLRCCIPGTCESPERENPIPSICQIIDSPNFFFPHQLQCLPLSRNPLPSSPPPPSSTESSSRSRLMTTRVRFHRVKRGRERVASRCC